MVHNPGGDWNPGWGVDLRYIFKIQAATSEAIWYIFPFISTNFFGKKPSDMFDQNSVDNTPSLLEIRGCLGKGPKLSFVFLWESKGTLLNATFTPRMEALLRDY